MKRVFHIILFVVILFTPFACQEIYDPKDLDVSQNIVVINGMVTNTDGPHKVTISYASPFTSSVTNYISGATVHIVDHTGQRWPLYEEWRGNYVTIQGQLTGIPGNQYHVEVILNDGTTYASTPITMQIPGALTGVYAEVGQKGSLIQNYDGSYQEQVERGLYIYGDLKNTQPNKQFYRFETYIAHQSVFYVEKMDEESGMPITIKVMCIDAGYYHDLPNTKTTLSTNNQQVIARNPIAFVPYRRGYKYYGETPSDPRDPGEAPPIYETTPQGWILTINNYTLNKEEFLYWDKVRRQLAANNHIFDPLPSSIKGNIKNVADTTQTVLGFFSVAPVVKQSHAFHWTPYTSTIRYQNADGYPYSYSTSFCNDSIMPIGWIGF